MSTQTQRNAVFAAIVSVLGTAFTEGMNVSPLMTKEIRSKVSDILVNGFNEGEITLSKTYATPADLKAYVSGLISNWVRKDSRLNGDTKYVAKNPGSRKGAADPQLKAMKALLEQPDVSDEDREEIQEFIDKRLSEIELSKKSTKVVDYSALPAALAEKYRPTTNN